MSADEDPTWLSWYADEGEWTIDSMEDGEDLAVAADQDRAEEDIRDRVCEYLDGDHDARTTDQPFLVELLSDGLFSAIGDPFDLPAYSLGVRQQALHDTAVEALVDFLDSLPLRDKVIADEIRRDKDDAEYNEREY